MTPLRFGVCFGGLEHAMENYTRQACLRFKPVTYFEVGVAYGHTMSAVARVMGICSQQWRAVGLDLPNGWSLGQPDIISAMGDYGVPCTIHNFPPGVPADAGWNSARVFLKASQEFFAKDWPAYPEGTAIHFALIDACHGSPCVMADFKAIEPHVPIGGVVAFHDFSPEYFGEPQHHCELGEVYGACERLGLVDNTRPGWRFAERVACDRSKDGRDLGVFERIA